MNLGEGERRTLGKYEFSSKWEMYQKATNIKNNSHLIFKKLTPYSELFLGDDGVVRILYL